MNINKNSDLISHLPQELKQEIWSYFGNHELEALSWTCEREKNFADQFPLQDGPYREKRLVSQCNRRAPRDALAYYIAMEGSARYDLDRYKWSVIRDIPFKSILSTILTTTAINAAFLFMNGMLTIEMIAALPMPFGVSFSYVLIVAALQYFNVKRGDWNIGKDEVVHKALGIIPIAAFYFLSEMPKVFSQLYKSSVWTTGYFLALHALTAGVLIMFNRCQDPSRLFNALGFFIVSVCLFRNMANSF